MKFLVYSSTNSDTIKSSLGAVDYSYYFVLENYLPLLRQFGEVEVLSEPLTDKEASHYQSLDDCYYLSFTPPNKVQLNHSIPVIPVFAWEFSTLPDTAFVSAADNWQYVLEQTGQAITHSQYAAKVVRNALGSSYPVASIPAPIWDGFDRVRQQRHQARLYLDQLALRATVIDSRDFEVSNGNPIPLKRPDLVRRRVIGKLWGGEELDLDCAEGTRLPPFSGFAKRADGKFWSEAECAWMILPGYLSGPLILYIELQSNEITSGQPLKIQFGNCSALIRVSEFASVHRLILDVQEAVNILHFSFPEPEGPDGDQSFCVHALSIKEFDTDNGDVSVDSELVCDQSVQWRGVHAIEPWGRWTAQEQSDVVLPLSISGDVMVSFTIVQSLMATGETFDVQLGHQVVTVLLSGLPQDVDLPFMNVACTDSLQIRRLGASNHVSSEDDRLLGLGLSKLTVTSWPLDLASSKLMSREGEELDLDCSAGTRLPPFSGFVMRADGKFWSEAECPWLILPGYFSGPLVLHIELESNGIMHGQMLKLQFGSCSVLVRVSEVASKHRLILDVQEAASILRFSFSEPTSSDHEQSFCVRALSIKEFDAGMRGVSDGRDLLCDESVQRYGFHDIEPWGRWTAQEESGVVLPFSVSGEVMVGFTIVNSSMALGEGFDVQLGDQVVTVLLSVLPQDVELPFMNVACTDSLQIKRLGASSNADSEGDRLLGLGLSRLTATSWPLDLSSKLMSTRGEELDLDCSAGTRLPPFSGFVMRADGRFWSEAECPWLIFPGYFSGLLVLHIELESNGFIPGQMLKLQFGNCSALVRVSEVASEHRLIWDVQEAASILRFSFSEPTGSDHEQSFCVRALSIKEFDAGMRGVSDGRDLLCDESVQRYGFHDIEPWGRWTAQEECGVVLPFPVSGEVLVGFTIVNSLMAAGEGFDVQLGDQVVTVLLSDLPQDVELPFVNVECTDRLQIKRLNAKSSSSAEDDRLLGLALAKITLASQSLAPAPVLTSVATTTSEPPTTTLWPIQRLEEAAPKHSVIYTTVFNPIDGRKNWPDIIKAFIFALRDKPGAVLIVKITHNELQPFLADICSYFVSLAPFKCRIVFVHGYIESGEYDDLIRATSFVVNASRGEGQCLPLMEFMSSGVPAIAPDNTAMSDYVNVENSFVVKSTIEPAVWPQDPRLLMRTTRYRVNWESLYAAYKDSYHVAVSNKSRYARMSRASVDALQQYCSLETTSSRFADFLSEIGRDDEC